MSTASRGGRALPWALVAVLLAGGLQIARALCALSRNGVQGDAMLLLRHPSGDLLDGVSRLQGPSLLRIALVAAPFFALLIVAWPRRARLAWKLPLVAGSTIAVLLLIATQVMETRSAVRTLCWAAKSPVYGRSVRDRALALGQDELRGPLGRLAEILGANARPTCAAAAIELGTADSVRNSTDR